MTNIIDYDEFRKQHELRHPASVPVLEIEMNEYPAWARWAVLLTFISAALVSGVHTVPTVWKSIEIGEIITPEIRNVVSLASLMAVELAILLSAYLMAKGVKLAYFVMGIASAVAIMANLYSVITAFTSGGDIGALIVAVFLGVGAPLITLFTGKMYVDIHRADRVQDAKARKVYREACIAWDKEIEREYKKQLKDNDKKSNKSDSQPVHTVHSLNSVNEQGTNSYSANSSSGYTKRMDARSVIREFFRQHPDKMNARLDDLLNEIEQESGVKVGRTSIHNVRNELLSMSNGHGTNGHSEV